MVIGQGEDSLLLQCYLQHRKILNMCQIIAKRDLEVTPNDSFCAYFESKIYVNESLELNIALGTFE